MPKIIPDIKDKILGIAEELIYEGSYSEFTARNIAKKCGIAVGTLYNYFPSMETLMISIIWGNWGKNFQEIDRELTAAASATEGICLLCEKIRIFAQKHLKFWTSSMKAGFSFSNGPEWRDNLRRWLASKIELTMSSHGLNIDMKYTPVIAEVIMALGANCNLNLDVTLAMLRQSGKPLESIDFALNI